MSNLKGLVTKANSGLSLSRKENNQRFGLGSFLAASTDQMLMTRGGYGSTGGSSTCIHGSYVGTCSFASCRPAGGDGYGGDVVQGFNNMIGSYNNSSLGQVINSIWNSVSNTTNSLGNFVINNMNVNAFISATAGLFNATLGEFLSSQGAGNGNRYYDNQGVIYDRTTGKPADFGN